MAIGQADIDRAVELFAGLGGITQRKMMGGLSLYHHRKIFAIAMADGQVFLKAAEDFAVDLEAAGCTRWSHVRKDGRRVSMGYWTLPEEAEDDPDLACDWARRALAYL